MTPEERAREIVDNDDWYEWVGEGYYLKPDTLAMNIDAAIRAAVEEAIAAAPKLYRGVKAPCPRCCGWGRRCYASTATWRGGMGGAMTTDDVCDACWGTGDAHNRGADLREMEAAIRGRKP